MAWTKPQAPIVARAGANDIELRFYVSDAAANPPNDLRVETHVGQDAADFSIQSSSLTPTQRTQLRNLLIALRDEALSRAGYVNV